MRQIFELEGSYTRCVLDSGSQVSTISASHYNDYLACKFALHPVDILVTIEAANGFPINYLGYVQVSICMASVVHSWSIGLFTLACCGLHVPQV